VTEMWVVSVRIGYYPYIEEFSNEEDARNYYNKELEFLRRTHETGKIYISRVEQSEKI
jgi:hypothetical protein